MKIRYILKRGSGQKEDVFDEAIVPDGFWALRIMEFARIAIHSPAEELKRSPKTKPASLEPRILRQVRTHHPVGAYPNEMSRFLIRHTIVSRGIHGNAVTEDVVLIAERPFGIVTELEDSERQWGKMFTVARTIKGGRLGRKPEIRTPRFVGECRDDQGKVPKWARLVDVAGFASMPPDELLQRYILFSDLKDPFLHVAFARSHEEISGKRMSHTRVDLREAQRLIAETLDRLWVRRGWAMTVLYLVHFGHRPVIRGALYATSKSR